MEKLRDPSETYTEEWFRDEYMRADEQPDYLCIAEALCMALSFDSVLDLGCGPGLVLNHLLARGKLVTGIEGSETAWTVMPPAVKPFITRGDLREKLPLGQPRDLVICTEVAEHLEKEYADALVNLVAGQASKYIFFTGATPGQGGLDHVNEQPRWYWLEKFAAHGWWLDRDKTRAFKQTLVDVGLKGLTWLLPNAMILTRE
jgi:SAM-dependent methyltransferase